MANKKTGLTYKGKPLVRCGNIIYYGDPAEKFIIMLQILESEPKGEVKLSKKVHIELQYADQDIKARDRIVKKSDKDNLYDAMDIASIWLTRALAEN